MTRKELRNRLHRQMEEETVSPSLKYRTLSRMKETRPHPFRPAAFACTAAVMAAAFLCLFALKQNLLQQSEPMNSPAAFAAPNATVTAAFDPVSPTPILEGTPDPTQVPALQATPITEADPTETPVLWTTSTPMPVITDDPTASPLTVPEPTPMPVTTVDPATVITDVFAPSEDETITMELIQVTNNGSDAELLFRVSGLTDIEEFSINIPSPDIPSYGGTCELTADDNGDMTCIVTITAEGDLDNTVAELHFGGLVSSMDGSRIDAFPGWDFTVTLYAHAVEFGHFDLPDGRSVQSLSVAGDRVRCTYTEPSEQSHTRLGIVTTDAFYTADDFSFISRSISGNTVTVEMVPTSPLEPDKVTGLCFLDESTGEILSCLGLPQLDAGSAAAP